MGSGYQTLVLMLARKACRWLSCLPRPAILISFMWHYAKQHTCQHSPSLPSGVWSLPLCPLYREGNIAIPQSAKTPRLKLVLQQKRQKLQAEAQLTRAAPSKDLQMPDSWIAQTQPSEAWDIPYRRKRRRGDRMSSACCYPLFHVGKEN